MAGINAAALRRALSEALSGARQGGAEFARDAGRGANVGFATGVLPEAYNQFTDDDPGVDAGRVLDQGLKGAILGAGGGAALGMGVRTGVRGVNALRSALADRAFMRTREAENAADTFGSLSPHESQQANPLDEIRDGQSRRDALGELRVMRRQATTKDELDDIDWQISTLMRDMGH